MLGKEGFKSSQLPRNPVLPLFGICKRQKTKYRAKRGFSGASSWHIFNENFFKSIKMYKPDTNVGDKGKISQYNKKGGENPRKNYLEEIDP